MLRCKDYKSLTTDSSVGAEVTLDCGVSLHDCDCEPWQKYIKLLDSYIQISSIRGATHAHYPKEGVFIYCPWCGKKREAN